MSQLPASHAQGWEEGMTSWDFVEHVQFLEGRSEEKAVFRITESFRTQLSNQ